MLEDGNGNGNDRFFIDAARQILKGVIIHLQNSHQSWTWEELHKTLFSDVKQLKQLLQKAYPSAAGLVEPDNKTTHSIISVLSSRLFWIRDMAVLQRSAKNTWCITEMMKHVDGKCHVFFRPNYSSPELSRAVCNTLVTLIIERLLAHEDSNSRKCFFILDELGNFPHNPSLIRWLTLSRSKGGRTIASAQSISLLYENYGQNNTETILSLFRTVIVMRLGASGPTAQKASDLLGQQRVLTVNQNLSGGDKLAISTQFADRPVVLKEDIINLPSADTKGVVGFLFIGGLVNIYKLKWPYIKSESPSNRQPISYSDHSKLTTPVSEVTANRLNKRSLLTDSNSKSIKS
jgi:type IV secretory pathway TraG/TraD family ATPase VirD4